jgi:hypothetical protein
VESQEEVGTLAQQPMALGYFVSTAKTGKMPQWFWASCPHLENANPAFLKNALHLHSPSIQNSDDLLQQQSQITVHPLDSTYTTDVLRSVHGTFHLLKCFEISLTQLSQSIFKMYSFSFLTIKLSWLLQVCAGRLQRSLVARAGPRHERPPVLSAGACASADAAVPHLLCPRLGCCR